MGINKIIHGWIGNVLCAMIRAISKESGRNDERGKKQANEKTTNR